MPLARSPGHHPHAVHAEVAGPCFADERVHVRAVHVEQRALGVEDAGDLVNVGLKHADGRRVGEHQRRGIFVDELLERGQVDHAEFVRLQIGHLVAADSRRRRVGPVRRVGDDDLFARIAAALVVCPRQQNAGELAVCAGRRLQRDAVHARDLDQAFTQLLHLPERGVAQALGLVRVRLVQAFQPRDGLVDARVVLHGARAERIHAEVDRVVPRRQPREVANDLDFAQLGHDAQVVAADGVAEQGSGIHRWYVQLGETVGLLAGRGLLKDERFVLVDGGSGLARCTNEPVICHS